MTAADPPANTDDNPPGPPPAGRVGVMLPRPLGGGAIYDYRVSEGVDAASGAPGPGTLVPGSLVKVPLGGTQIFGAVWREAEGAVEESRLKEIAHTVDLPPLPDVTRRFVDWVAAYTLSSPGAVLRMVLSVPDALEPPKDVIRYRAAAAPPAFKMTPQRAQVLEAASDGAARSGPDLARRAGVGVPVVRKLAELGGLVSETGPAETVPPPPDSGHHRLALSTEQAAAADALAEATRGEDFSVHLLDGVTGSGKTEVYLEALAAVIEAGGQALVLLPEISLSEQWLDRFERRFGVKPALWHSEIGASARRATWRQVLKGEVPVVVGARSALFLPFADLRLIVVDEEHDASFKQEDGVLYHARDMAVVRARLGGHPVILASATPSLETLENVSRGRYQTHRLTSRHGGAALPEMALIDLRKTPPARGQWLAPPAVEAVRATLERGEQTLLFLNRRGYAPLTLCRACGHRFQCPQCSTWLVEHRLLGRLQCHHCGLAIRPPDRCPDCGTEDALVACGPGVERLAEEAQGLFPSARLAIAASDTLTSPKALRQLLAAIEAGEVDIIVGTQVAAKGHHFPALTLVIAVDADLGLAGGDLRAGERTYQMLHQVAGRAGRAGAPGRALLQTRLPDTPAIAALLAGDRDGFLAAERDGRAVSDMPPFGRLAALIVSGPNASEVDRASRALAATAPTGEGLSVLGPAPAPLSLVRGRHRRRLLLKATRNTKIQPMIRMWMSKTALPKSVRVKVDIDPVSFM